MEDHIPLRPDRGLLLGRQTFKLSLWDAVFHENDSNSIPHSHSHLVSVLIYWIYSKHKIDKDH